MPEETAQAEVELPRLQDMTEAERQAFLKDDTLPEAKETPSDDTAKAEVKTGAESEPATKEESTEEEPRAGKSRYQRRIDRLTAQVKELEARLSAPSGNETRTEQVKTESTSKAPKWSSFQDQVGTKYANEMAAWNAYEDAREEYQDNRAAIMVKAERAKLESEKAQETARQITEGNAKEFAKRAADYRKTLAKDSFQESFNDVYEAVNEAMIGRPDVGQIADALVESEVGPELIHYYGQRPEEFDKLLEMPVARALRELGKLEVSAEIKTPTPKTKTAAKRIGSGVSGAGANSSTDPEWEAAEKNDIRIALKADPVFAKRRGSAW
jgi:hypothetical protein